MGCSHSILSFDAVAPAPDGNVSGGYRHRSDQQSRLSYFGMKMKRGIAPVPIFHQEPNASSAQSMAQNQAVLYNGRFSPEPISGQPSQRKPLSTHSGPTTNVKRGVNASSTRVPITKAADSLKLGLEAAAIESKQPKQGAESQRMISPLLAINGVTNTSNPSSRSPQRNAVGPLSVDAHLAATHITAENGLQYRDRKNDPTNFFAAVKKGDMSTIQTLITSATNVSHAPGDKSLINTTGMWNTSPLMTAIQYGHLAVADYLLQQSDIDVNHANEKGSTAMLLACADGHAALVKRLLDLGAHGSPAFAPIFYNPATDKSGPATPLSIACTNGHDACVDVLLSMNTSGSSSSSSSGGGCSVNQLFEFQLLFRTGQKRKMTPLLVACLYRRCSVVQVLIKHKVDCSMTDDNAATVLSYLALAGDHTMELYALLHDYVGELQLQQLAQTSEHVNAWTALHHACERKHQELVIILLRLHANLNAQTLRPLTGNDSSKGPKRPPKVPILSLERIVNAQISSSIGKTIKDGNEGSSTPDSKAAALNAASKKGCGETPLHIAIRRRAEEIVSLLLAAGADPFVVDASGISPWDMTKNIPNGSAMAMAVETAVQSRNRNMCNSSNVSNRSDVDDNNDGKEDVKNKAIVTLIASASDAVSTSLEQHLLRKSAKDIIDAVIATSITKISSKGLTNTQGV